MSAAVLLRTSTVAQSGPVRSTPPEVELTRTLLSDTVTRTVSYLPRGYWFGLADRSQGSLVLVKDGPQNYILRDGTHEVYRLGLSAGQPALQRLDSSVFSGDNFHMMAFLRKDTIYQYGGYGFWNTRDFFMRYRQSGRDWEFLTGGTGLANELNYHFYDRDADAFYVLGSLSSSHHPYSRKIFVDSVYRYDFQSRRWAALGRMEEAFDELDARGGDPLSLCFSPFGLIDTRTQNLRLFDIPGNRVLGAGSRLADTAMLLGRRDRLQDAAYRLFLYLGDTLHGLKGDSEQVQHVRIRITPADFDTSPAQRIYVPVGASSKFGFPVWARWVAALSLPMTGMAWVFRRRRRRLLQARPDPDPMIAGTAVDPAVVDARVDEGVPEPHPEGDIAFFRSQLSPAELDLLDLLVRHSKAGRATDSQTLNKVLGVSSKADSIQKARRSVTMNSINDTFRKTLKQESPLLVRDRDEVDKRAFVYRVDERYLGLFGEC